MPKVKDPLIPQFNAGQALFGAIPIEMLPNGSAPGQIPYWDGIQWHMVKLVAGAGTNYNYDPVNKELQLNFDDMIIVAFPADAALIGTYPRQFTADAELA